MAMTSPTSVEQYFEELNLPTPALGNMRGFVFLNLKREVENKMAKREEILPLRHTQPVTNLFQSALNSPKSMAASGPRSTW